MDGGGHTVTSPALSNSFRSGRRVTSAVNPEVTTSVRGESIPTRYHSSVASFACVRPASARWHDSKGGIVLQVAEFKNFGFPGRYDRNETAPTDRMSRVCRICNVADDLPRSASLTLEYI